MRFIGRLLVFEPAQERGPGNKPASADAAARESALTKELAYRTGRDADQACQVLDAADVGEGDRADRGRGSLRGEI